MTELGSTNFELIPFPSSKVALRIWTLGATTMTSTINLSQQLCSRMMDAHCQSRSEHGCGCGSGLLPMSVCVLPLFNPLRGHRAWTITMLTTIYSVLKGWVGVVEPGNKVAGTGNGKIRNKPRLWCLHENGLPARRSAMRGKEQVNDWIWQGCCIRI